MYISCSQSIWNFVFFQAFGLHGHNEEEHAHGEDFMEKYIGFGLAALAGKYEYVFVLLNGYQLLDFVHFKCCYTLSFQWSRNVFITV